MKRPIFLTLLLIILFLMFTVSIAAYIGNSEAIKQSTPNLPEWSQPFTVIAFFCYLLSIVFIWKWKKIGFYMFIGTAVLIVSLGWIAVGQVDFKDTIVPGITSVILYFAMKPVWDNFK